MDSFEFNQMLMAIVLIFNIVVLITNDNNNIIITCSNGDTFEMIGCIFNCLYIWMIIVNILYLIYIIYCIIKMVRSCFANCQRQYIEQIDNQPPIV